ncbi:MAG: hypothetical protein QNJ72_39010 [Pleurocapsa sp. MO_226.B13]|nr:hypothetical protein [Pleurocapsa sp. MO_226.B13]
MKAIEDFLSKKEEKGNIIPKENLIELNGKLNDIIPNWYIEMFSKYPLAGLEVAWQAYPDEEGDDSIEWVQLLDFNLLTEINLESYPGIYLFPNGYFSFGYGSSWAGNCFVFNHAESDDPAVYEVWCDAAQSISEMKVAFKEGTGVKKVSDSFSEFFIKSVK